MDAGQTQEAVNPTTNESELTHLKSNVKLYPHQEQAVVHFLSNNDRILLAHGTGTGKTLTSIATALAAMELGKAKKVLVVVPTSLQSNYLQNLQEFTKGIKYQDFSPKNPKIDPNSQFLVVGYNYFIRHKDDIEQEFHPDMLMVDEVHHIRNPKSSLFRALWEIRQNVDGFVGMTGSMLNNKPEELIPLISMVEGHPITTTAQFERKYTQYVSTVRNPFGGSKKFSGFSDVGRVAKAVAPAVSYVSTEQLHGLPKKTVVSKEVPMSQEQWDAYKYALQQLGPIKKLLYSRQYASTLPMQKLNTVFGKLITLRKLSNSVSTLHPNEDLGKAALQTPKIRTMLNDVVDNLMKHPDAKVVIYSNLINSGLSDVAAAAKELGLKVGVFAGKGNVINGEKITDQSRQQAIDDFKKGKIRVLLVSPAGSEGISLPDATDLYMLDMHFNPQQILQAEARIRRIDSIHPKVTIHEYYSVKPKRFFSFLDKTPSIDEWIHDVAMAKYKGLAPMYSVLSRANKMMKTPPLKQTMRILLEKRPNTKYVERWKDDSGKIHYKYDNGNKFQPIST